ncbi:MAG: hypothetical protein PWQ96_168 [Clostridia bacterium]|nr:hypothetical protein [Clostridia bacterium]
MDRIPLWVVVFQSLPESIILFYLGLASIGIQPNFRRVLPAAIISSAASWLVRGLPLPFGLHTLIGLMIISCLLLVMFRIELLKAFIAGLFAVSSLLATEVILLPVVTKLAGVAGFQAACGHPVQRIVLSLPEQVFLGAVAYLLIRFKISFQSLARRTETNMKEEQFDK